MNKLSSFFLRKYRKKFFLFLRKIVATIIPRNSAFRRALLAIYRNFLDLFGRYNVKKYNKAIEPLLDINVLNERIRSIKDLAESGAVSKKKFYIISRGADNVGLFSYVITHFSQILYALAKGMIPIIDMQYSFNPYLERDKLGNENSWEYFFKQPCGYSLDDVNNGECAFSDPNFFQSILPFITDNNLWFKNNNLWFEGVYFQLWATVYRNFFQLSDSAAKYIEEEFNRIIKPGMRVVGVYCRGTDYTKMRLAGHAIQPEVDEVINKVKSVMPEWNCDYVYVTTEESEIVKRFENAFPGRVLTVKQMYYDDIGFDFEHQQLVYAKFDRDNDAYLKGLEYLSSVIVFSRCNSAVLGHCGGSEVALYINGGKFENVYFYNLGFY